MRCLFINLSEATARKARMEAGFQASAPECWTLERIEAAGPADATSIPGKCSPGAKACLLSHRRALQRALESAGDVLILEDDTALSARGLQILQKILATPALDFDILMTDVGLLKPEQMVAGAKLREAYAATSQVRVQDLSDVMFIGSSAYVVREAAKSKLLGLLNTDRIDLPYDVALRELILRGQLRARFTMPALTTISDDAHQSQISSKETRTVAAINAYRRLMFIDRDLDTCTAALTALAQTTPPEARLYGPIFAVVVAGDQ